MSKKIAFLCLAHNNFDYLAYASHYYCAEGDGFFLHVDAAINTEDLAIFSDFHPNTVLLNKNERKRTFWGSFSIVLATVALIKKALEKDNYDRFILISGVDLPLLTKANLNVCLTNEACYFGQWHMVDINKQDSSISNEFFKRHHYDFSLTNPGEAYNTGKRIKIYRMLLLNRLLAYLPLPKKRFIYKDYIKGSQWWVITADMAKYFYDTFQQPEIIKQFSLMHAPDEKIFHTLAHHSPFKHQISNDDGQASLKQGLHYIDWGYQKDKVALQPFDLADVAKAKHLGCAFSRKLLIGNLPEYQLFIDNLLIDKLLINNSNTDEN